MLITKFHFFSAPSQYRQLNGFFLRWNESFRIWRVFLRVEKSLRLKKKKWCGNIPSSGLAEVVDRVNFFCGFASVCMRACVCVCVCESVCVRTRRMLCRVRQIQSSAAGCWEKSSRVEKPSKTETRTFYCGVWGRLQLQSSKWITANNSARTRESRRPCGLSLPPFFIFRGEFWFVLTGT